MLILEAKKSLCTIDKYVLIATFTGYESHVHVVSILLTKRNVDKVNALQDAGKISEFYAARLLANMYEQTPRASYFEHDPNLSTELSTSEFIEYMDTAGAKIPFTAEDTVKQAIEKLKNTYGRLFYRNIETNLT